MRESERKISPRFFGEDVSIEYDARMMCVGVRANMIFFSSFSFPHFVYVLFVPIRLLLHKYPIVVVDVEYACTARTYVCERRASPV